MGKRKNFPPKVKLKALSCCDRHCCLCDKQCGTQIEIHHIKPIEKGGGNSFDNAIPLCFDCHAKAEMYNDKHPRGIKYKEQELKERRNQVYDKYTSPYVPPIQCRITEWQNNQKLEFPNARFIISNLHDYLCCKVRIVFSIYHNKRLLRRIKEGYYGGKIDWRMNPQTTVNCPRNFKGMAGKNFPKKINHFQVEIAVTIIDKFGWEHELLPVSWMYMEGGDWFFEPFQVK